MSEKIESKFWKLVKIETPKIKWVRIENWACFGTPDLLGYNENHKYFTVELKVSRSKKLHFSPHQIGYCITHPINHFILSTPHAPLSPKLYEGKNINELLKTGIETPNALACDWNAVRLCLYRL